MMITYKSRFLTRAEVWFDNDADRTRPVDWILYQQRSQPVPGAKTRHFYTYLIDLEQSHNQLLANLNKDTAYKIRRARERDKIGCEECDPLDRKDMEDFEEMYNAFAVIKGRAPLNRARMESMAAAGVLHLSVANDAQGNALVYHANYRDSHRATSLELPSLYHKLSDSASRSLISRANRYLTWTNILQYKDEGLKRFDFGGWYAGSVDRERLDINRFKEGFGGTVVREYQCEQIRTIKGWLALHTAGLQERMKSVLSRPLEPSPSHQLDREHDRIPVPAD